jgi:hypothetical protein
MAYAYRLSGTNGCELLGPDGVVAWTIESELAARIVKLLNEDRSAQCRPDQTTSFMRNPRMPLSKEQIQRLIRVLLRNRPDLVIVKTETTSEKKELVRILEAAGAKPIYHDDADK